MNRKADLGKQVLKQLSSASERRRGSAAALEHAGALEKIVLAEGRPALMVEGGTFSPAVSPIWRATLEDARRFLEAAIASVGKISIERFGRRQMLGTGWVVAPSLVVTNRHVAKVFARYGASGEFPLRVDTRGNAIQAVIDFKGEHLRKEELCFSILKVLYMAPDDDLSPDVALLSVAATSRDAQRPLPAPLFLSEEEPAEQQIVAAIGFPARDFEEDDQAAMKRYFGSAYEVKRLSPGFVTKSETGKTIFHHDCTTLGGSSGSALIDLVGGRVLGLHFSGSSGVTNYAVKASAIAACLRGLSVAPAVPAAPSVVPAEEGTGKSHKPDFFKARKGYDVQFLGQEVSFPLPTTPEQAASVSGGGIELRYEHFSVIQHKGRRFPWITGVNIDGKSLRRPPRASSWFRDGRLEEEEQFGDEIYSGSGFSRGHMVRRLDPCWGSDDEVKRGNEDTFHFTNACPQEQNQFNDKLWGNLEDYILDEADAEHIKISVFTGPIFRDEDPFVRDAQIPLEFWKIVAWRSKNKLKSVGFMLSQEPFIDIEFAGGPYRTSERSLKAIGRDAGIDFGRALLDADVHGNEEASGQPLLSFEDLRRYF